MNIKKFDKGMLAANCFLLYKNNEAIVIDPGVKAEYILAFLNENKIRLKYIVFTHAHIDHILHSKKLKDKTSARIIVHELDNELLIDSYKNGSLLFGLNKKFDNGDILVNEKDKIKFADIELDIIHTPGHTPGGICIYYDKHMFTGDTLFYMSIGRTDLGMGNHQQLLDSIKNKLFQYDDDVIIYPGHGTNSTIGFEKNNNTYL